MRPRLGGLRAYEWVVFTSANAVGPVFERLRDARDFAGAKVAAIGDGTAAALRSRGVEADLVPARFVAESLVEAFPGPPAPGAAVLVPRAAVARDVLPDGLAALGYRVDVVEAYRTVHPPPSDEVRAALSGADAVTFTSSSTVTGLVELAGPASIPAVVACIGPVTAATARRHGLAVAVEAGEHTVEAWRTRSAAARGAGTRGAAGPTGEGPSRP